jgi:hypothetical protein
MFYPGPSLARPAVALVLGLALAATAAAARPASLPGDLRPGDRARLVSVTESATLSARHEAEPFEARIDVFEYLIDHPEFATHVTRALRVARYRIWREADGLHIDDGWGTRGRFEIVHAARGVRVMYARGEYEQRLLPNIGGEAVVVVEYASRPGPAGAPRIVPTLTGFVKLDSRILAAVASRLASSIAQDKAKLEAARLAKVFMKVGRAIEQDPAGVYDLVRRHDGVPARELEEFRALLNLPRTATP